MDAEASQPNSNSHRGLVDALALHTQALTSYCLIPTFLPDVAQRTLDLIKFIREKLAEQPLDERGTELPKDHKVDLPSPIPPGPVPSSSSSPSTHREQPTTPVPQTRFEDMGEGKIILPPVDTNDGEDFLLAASPMLYVKLHIRLHECKALINSGASDNGCGV